MQIENRTNMGAQTNDFARKRLFSESWDGTNIFTKFERFKSGCVKKEMALF